MSIDDRPYGTADEGTARPRARCVVLAPPQRGVRADLATVLGQRGAAVEITFDALGAMTQLGVWHIMARQRREQAAIQGQSEMSDVDRAGTILLLAHPAELGGVAALTESVKAYFPEVTIATFGENGSSRITVQQAGQAPVTECEPSQARDGSTGFDGLPRVVVMPRHASKAASPGPSLRLVKDDRHHPPTDQREPDRAGQTEETDDGDDGAQVSAEELAMLLARDDDDDFGDPNHGGGMP